MLEEVVSQINVAGTHAGVQNGVVADAGRPCVDVAGSHHLLLDRESLVCLLVVDEGLDYGGQDGGREGDAVVTRILQHAQQLILFVVLDAGLQQVTLAQVVPLDVLLAHELKDLLRLLYLAQRPVHLDERRVGVGTDEAAPLLEQIVDLDGSVKLLQSDSRDQHRVQQHVITLEHVFLPRLFYFGEQVLTPLQIVYFDVVLQLV